MGMFLSGQDRATQGLHELILNCLKFYLLTNGYMTVGFEGYFHTFHENEEGVRPTSQIFNPFFAFE